MASTGKRQSKTAFLMEQLQKNPNVTVKEAADAWKAAGNEGTIISSIFYYARSVFNKRTAGATASPSQKTKTKASKGSKSKAKTTTTQSSARSTAPEPKVKGVEPSSQVLDEVEGGIDDLIFRLKEVGGVPDVEAALRQARRMIAQKHGQ
jgi:hypothetical protein